MDEVLVFPCDFPIKIIGQATDAFEITALNIIHQYAPDLAENAITTRHSKDKRYLAMTVTIHATCQEQLDQIYQALSDADEVLIVL